jgi:hypothetical protein
VPLPEPRCAGLWGDNPALMRNFHERVPGLTADNGGSGFISARYGQAVLSANAPDDARAGMCTESRHRDRAHCISARSSLPSHSDSQELWPGPIRATPKGEGARS